MRAVLRVVDSMYAHTVAKTLWALVKMGREFREVQQPLLCAFMRVSDSIIAEDAARTVLAFGKMD
jgi:hypothetical protein